MNDCFVTFWVGMLAGVVVGIAVSGILAAIANAIEYEERNNDYD